MRGILFCFVIMFLISCKPTADKSYLLGTWETVYDKVKYPNNNIQDKLTFYENDSLVVEYYVNGRLQESVSGSYSLDAQKMMLTTKYGKTNFQFEVITLNKETLTAKQIGSKNTVMLKKL